MRVHRFSRQAAPRACCCSYRARATSSGTFSFPNNDTCCWTPSSSLDGDIISRETCDALPARVCEGDSNADHVNTASEHLRVCGLCSGNHQKQTHPNASIVVVSCMFYLPARRGRGGSRHDDACRVSRVIPHAGRRFPDQPRSFGEDAARAHTLRIKEQTRYASDIRCEEDRHTRNHSSAKPYSQSAR